MTTYRLSLISGDESTSVDFEASRDSDAAMASTAVFQSCTDLCDSFELRRNASWVAGMNRTGIRHELLIEELTAKTQELVLQAEETLVRSRSRIATSRRLLERTEQMSRLVGRAKS